MSDSCKPYRWERQWYWHVLDAEGVPIVQSGRGYPGKRGVSSSIESARWAIAQAWGPDAEPIVFDEDGAELGKGHYFTLCRWIGLWYWQLRGAHHAPPNTPIAQGARGYESEEEARLSMKLARDAMSGEPS